MFGISKDEQWKKQNIPRYLTGVYLKFWYENPLFEKSYQESKELLMTVFDATKQEDIRKFHKLKLNDTKELISFLWKNFRWGRKLNYDDSSIVEHMTLSSPIQYQKFLVIKKISTPCEWISTMRQLIAVTPDSADRKPVDTGSYTDGITKPTVVFTEELIHGTDSSQEEIMDSLINLT
ncbi:hypothetical protein TNCV_399451 [Trichonephila clavipes]|nr:hypothetical protein TNCV_399451 [Trichonephila clavipes]